MFSTLDPVQYLFAARLLLYLFSLTNTFVIALANWLPVCHLQWFGHITHVRHHLHTIIVWNSPMQELINSVMVFSLLLPPMELSPTCFFFFWLPSTFLPSKGRSATTFGTGWHDFFFFFFFFFFLHIYYYSLF